MKILLIAKLANHTIKENVLMPILASGVVEQVFVLRDIPGENFDSRIHYVSCGAVGQIRHLKKVAKGVLLCNKHKIDAIIGVLNTPHGYIGRMVGWLTGIPFVYMTIAGHREFWLDGKHIEQFRLKLFKNSSAITVTGLQTMDYLLKKGYNRKKIFVLPNLPNSYFNTICIDDNKYRKYDIVSFSRIDANKNLILLVKAISTLKKKGTMPKVVVAGDGDQFENIVKATQEYQVNDCFEFLGYISNIDDKIAIYSNSKIFISCSKGEGFPVSLLEAMGCGCVPVVSNVGDIADVIKQGYNGYIYNDTDDETEMAVFLLGLLNNPNEMTRLSSSALDIKQQISVENNGKIWREILLSTLK